MRSCASEATQSVGTPHPNRLRGHMVISPQRTNAAGRRPEPRPRTMASGGPTYVDVAQSTP